MPGPDGEDDGVDPEEEDEDDDEDVCGGEVWLRDSPLVEGREDRGPVGHHDNTGTSAGPDCVMD